MDKILCVFRNTDGSIRPEIVVAYGAVAILVSVLVNWALAVLLFMLKPFTCAAILMAFIRPDLAQNFLQEDTLRPLLERSKFLFLAFTKMIVKLGEQFQEKFN